MTQGGRDGERAVGVLVRAAVGARRKFFRHLEALTAYCYFQDWQHLMDFMMRGQEVGPYAVQKS